MCMDHSAFLVESPNGRKMPRKVVSGPDYDDEYDDYDEYDDDDEYDEDDE